MNEQILLLLKILRQVEFKWFVNNKWIDCYELMSENNQSIQNFKDYNYIDELDKCRISHYQKCELFQTFEKCSYYSKWIPESLWENTKFLINSMFSLVFMHHNLRWKFSIPVNRNFHCEVFSNKTKKISQHVYIIE